MNNIILNIEIFISLKFTLYFDEKQSLSHEKNIPDKTKQKIILL